MLTLSNKSFQPISPYSLIQPEVPSLRDTIQYFVERHLAHTDLKRFKK